MTRRSYCECLVDTGARGLTMAGMAAVVDEKGDLRCSYCGYDLRGLPANRCPECGKVFDLSSKAAAGPKPIGWLGGLLRLAWPVLPFYMGALLMLPDYGVARASMRARATTGCGLFLGLLGMPTFLLVCIPNVWELAGRVLVTLGRPPRAARSTRRRVGTFTLLFVLELVLLAGGCYCWGAVAGTIITD